METITMTSSGNISAGGESCRGMEIIEAEKRPERTIRRKHGGEDNVERETGPVGNCESGATKEKRKRNETKGVERDGMKRDEKRRTNGTKERKYLTKGRNQRRNQNARKEERESKCKRGADGLIERVKRIFTKSWLTPAVFQPLL